MTHAPGTNEDPRVPIESWNTADRPAALEKDLGLDSALAATSFADCATVYRIESDGSIRSHYTAWPPSSSRPSTGSEVTGTIDPHPDRALRNAIVLGEPRWGTFLQPEELDLQTEAHPRRPAFDSFLFVPLDVHHAVRGALGFFRADPGRRFTEDDCQLGFALAAQAVPPTPVERLDEAVHRLALAELRALDSMYRSLSSISALVGVLGREWLNRVEKSDGRASSAKEGGPQ